MYQPAPTAARFEIGRVLSRTFQVVGHNFPAFFVCALVFSGLPQALIGFLQTQTFGRGILPNPMTSSLIGLAALPVIMVASALLQATIIHGTIADLNGRRASVGDGLSVALRLLLPLVGIAIVVGIATTLAAFLLIVPGIIVALVYSVAIPVQVVERRGVFESMSRSADLTRGNRASIFGLGVIFILASIVIGAVVGGVVGVASAAAPGSFSLVNAILLTPLIQTVTTLFGAAGVASIYYELRYIRDGVGLQELASVFD